MSTHVNSADFQESTLYKSQQLIPLEYGFLVSLLATSSLESNSDPLYSIADLVSQAKLVVYVQLVVASVQDDSTNH
jgi:hypothetical protein